MTDKLPIDHPDIIQQAANALSALHPEASKTARMDGLVMAIAILVLDEYESMQGPPGLVKEMAEYVGRAVAVTFQNAVVAAAPHFFGEQSQE